MATPDPRYCPIIYVRGYAMTQGEIDDTTADPFCGFNLGSTVFRARPGKNEPPKKFVFESPLVRLRADFDYADVYDEGIDIVDSDWKPDAGIPARSIVIYRYYDSASNILGNGKTPSIKEFAQGLSELVLRVRDLVCMLPENKIQKADFRCYLVAHSMGGLVCRAFLQNPKFGSRVARDCIDKVFTYATPHNGIEMAGINVPSWLTASDMDNFNHEKMADYLNIKSIYSSKKMKEKRVDWLPEETFPSSRFFCMIGTNRSDYDVAAGISRTFSGHGSDGLVKVDNASVWGVDANGNFSAPSATAYAYRAHSGYFGIVNSEESYQNLVRFLFGDVRVDIWVDIDLVRLPKDIQDEANDGKEVNALYQIEILAAPRGKRWFLTRRTSEEDSVACRTHKELSDKKNKSARTVYLSSVFLARRYRVEGVKTLAYSLTLGIRVPDYEVEKRFWPDKHYEGGFLFRDSMVIELLPPSEGHEDWVVKYDWQSDRIGEATTKVPVKELKGGKVELAIPFSGVDYVDGPGISGRLRFVISEWNA